MNGSRQRVHPAAKGSRPEGVRSFRRRKPKHRLRRGAARYGTLLAVLTLVLSGCSSRGPEPLSLNFTHLLHLTERAQHANTALELVHVYAEYPDYEWVDAAGEGTACVDDAARAAVLWLREAEATGRGEAQRHARRLLRFLLYMQREDGTFANFVDRRLQPNLEGRTSRPCLCWWTARAAWALAEGMSYFSERAPAFADSLREALVRLRRPVDSLLVLYGVRKVGVAMSYPTWLIHGSGADASAVLVLALLEAREALGKPWADRAARQLLDGILAMQVTDRSDTLYGALLCYEDLWHAWGANQLYALVRAWEVLRDPRYLQAAEAEARHWWGRLLVRGFVHRVDLKRQRSSRYPQIAYDIRPATWGLLALAGATGEELWSVAAGLWASWLLGNNAAALAMYDSLTGRCFDEIIGPEHVNRNSGAESTIEALLTLQAVQADPVARRAVSARWQRRWTEGDRTLRLARTPEGRAYALSYDEQNGLLLVQRASSGILGTNAGQMEGLAVSP